MTDIFRSSLLKRVPHGFPGRNGGVSSGAFTSLNLGRSTADQHEAVTENRRRVLEQFAADSGSVCLVHQVHGTRVIEAQPAGSGTPEQADALHSADPELLLAVSFADCQPILYFDPDSGAAAAAHCGWRGTVAGLAGKVVTVLSDTYGTDPARLLVALGPAICRACYQVGPDVAGPFTEAGLGAALHPDPGTPGRHRLDLTAANRSFLRAAGVPESGIDDLRLCTSCQADSFYSHRRDAGTTGRHWGLIRPGRPH